MDRSKLLDRMNKLDELCCDDMDSAIRGGARPSDVNQPLLVGPIPNGDPPLLKPIPDVGRPQLKPILD